MRTFYTLLIVVFAQAIFSSGASAQCVSQAYIPNQNDNTVSVIDLSTNTATATIPVGSSPLGVSISPDGSKIYVTNQGGSSLSVIDAATNTVTATVLVGNAPTGISVSPDGSNIYVANLIDNTVSVVDAVANTVVVTVPVGNFPLGVSVSPDGSKVYIADFDDNTMSVMDAATNTVVALVPVGNNPQGISVSPDGSNIYVTNQGSNTVSVIDAVTNTVVATIPVGSGPLGVSISPDGSKIYVTNQGGSSLSVIDAATNTVTATVLVGNAPTGISVSPDGSNIYVANLIDNTVNVVDAATNAVISTIAVGLSPGAFGNFISSCSLPLPLTFLSFTAQLKNKDSVALRWQTTNEINTDYFIVERSTDGRNYSDVGHVPAQSIAGINDYTYTDNALPLTTDGTTIYYRLEEIDKGSRTPGYSHIATVKTGSVSIAEDFSISMYPNPAQNNVWITGAGIRQIRILDNTGRTCITQQGSSGNITEINITALRAGVYVVNILDAEGEQVTQKLVISR